MKEKIINQNKNIHNKLFKVYNLKHSEIYNPIEQNRIKEIISELVKNRKNLNVLDVGAGTGNLSLKFLDKNCKVVASDVSINSLNLLKKLSNNNINLKLKLIENERLPLEDNQFDIVCTYSVLHHIPDYLFTFQEMIRVCKPNGLIYIDHEANKNKYFPSECLKEYYSLTKQTRLEHLIKIVKTKEIFTYHFFKSAFIKIFINKKHQREGDIHVWKDDYIDWDKIKEIIKKENCKILKEVDYLMYKPKGGKNYIKSIKILHLIQNLW